MQLHTKILLGMAVGVVLGFLLGPNSLLLPAEGAHLAAGTVVYTEPDGEPMRLAEGTRDMRIVGERPGEPAWLELEWRLGAPDLLRLRARGVEEARGVEAGQRLRGFVRDEAPAIERYAPIGRTLVGATEWIGQLFLALIKMVVVPLVFFSLLVGVASLGDFRRLGRLGLRTVVFFLLTTVVALTIGVTLANLVRPGKLLDDRDRAALLASYEDAATDTVAEAAEAPGLTDQLLAIVPSNPLQALAEGDMLQIIFFALMLGVALTFLEAKRARLVVDVADRINDAMVMLVHIVMKLAPYGVAALLFKVAGTTGPTVLLALGAYALVVLSGLFLHVSGTYLAAVRLGARLPFLTFLRAIRPALLVGFSTSSSSATLPVTMECCEDNLGVSKQVTSFVLPLGATVNMDGTALYQGVAALFIAQIYDMDLSLAEQGTVILSATLASIGAAGVPGAGMITLAMVLTAVGVPTEGLALVLGVDRLLDMFRTAVNIAGDCTATAFMARLEGERLAPLSAAADAADPERGFEHRLDHDQSKVEPDP